MKLLLLLLLCAGARADREHGAADDAGIEVTGKPIRGSTINWLRTKKVDFKFGSEVVSVGRASPEGTHGNTLSPTTGKRVAVDDNAPVVPLADPVPTGVRFDGGGGAAPFEGLMQSQNDPSGNVGRLEIPGQPTTVINGPQKLDGSPLTQQDLMRLGQGMVSAIPLRGGRVLQSPQKAVSG